MEVRRLLVDDKKNSECGSASLRTLDFTKWWTDSSFGTFYLHVAGPEETWHRVYCKHHDKPALKFVDGLLYWLITSDSTEAV